MLSGGLLTNVVPRETKPTLYLDLQRQDKQLNQKNELSQEFLGHKIHHYQDVCPLNQDAFKTPNDTAYIIQGSIPSSHPPVVSDRGKLLFA